MTLTFITLINIDTVTDEIDDAHDPDIWISTIGVAIKFNSLLEDFLM